MSEKVIEIYCTKRCHGYPSCKNCKCDTSKKSCHLGFFVELYEVIDLKTLTKLSYYDIPNIYNMYINKIYLAITSDFESWLLNNKRYKITKKENEL